MDFFFYPQSIAGLLALLLLYRLWRTRRTHNHKTSKGMLPPEPAGAWPLIGHLHILGAQNTFARTLAAMADEYGPIYRIWLGVHSAIVVSSWEAVKECFTANDRAFAGRPISSVNKYLGYDNAMFGFAPYGPYWREIRKLALLELLSSRRLEAFKGLRVSELEISIRELFSLSKKTDGDAPAKVVISEWIDELTLNIIVRMISGKRYIRNEDGTKNEEEQHFRRTIREFMHETGAPVLSDVIPFPLLKWIDFQSHLKSMKRISKELDSIFGSWVQEHVQRRIENEKGDEQDFIDVMLSGIEDTIFYGYTRETVIKATVSGLILAGSDTTSISLTWLFSTLLNNKQALKRAQEEIELKVGTERWVEESDIKNLVYLQAIVKETLLLYPPAPLSVPHEALEDCHLAGYHIPKGSRLFVNVWKLHRDPRIWSEPDKFMPERFLTSHAEVDVSGQHFELIPFGSGRRSCPGITLAMQVTHLTLARLLQGFDFATPGNEPVDMTEGSGITMPKATPLEVVITPRLPFKLYENNQQLGVK
ncbi:hypothetical protein F0562_020982 [Nyssa sinensis]|uniref:Cytochrome P450 n=1 Tax=Nyssa sinensis TaxID=561372 RepID=A0A5J5BKC0_9ASTE|nr:hypothetical protein F0562_020982 [Nyssa sinensis]